MSGPQRRPGPGAKVAIPRLQRPYDNETPPSPDKQRVSRACTMCRKRKVKCSGELPRCANCRDNEQQCEYNLARRDRLKSALDQNQEMIRLLRDLRSRATLEDVRLVDDILKDMDEDPISAPGPSLKRSRSEEGEGEEGQGEADARADAGSNEGLDQIDEDLDRDEKTRATGFVGKSSEVQWLRRLKADMTGVSSFGNPHGSDNGSPTPSTDIEQVSASTFYLDNSETEINEAVDQFDMPPADVAQQLFTNYMDTIQDHFPIIPRRSFERQFYKYYESMSQGTRMAVPQKWLAILNLIFAIGTKFSHLVRVDGAADEKEHLLYQTRARLLGAQDPAVFLRPDLAQIQVTALMALYYLCVGQVSRAWLTMGMAIRSAYALGLHVRNKDPSASPLKREYLSRIWWSLYLLERLLSATTGRPSFVAENNCAVPLPLPIPEHELSKLSVSSFPEEQPTSSHSLNSPSSAKLTGSIPGGSSLDSPQTPNPQSANSGTLLRARIQVACITQDALSSIYAAGTVFKSWKEAQAIMRKLHQQLTKWEASIPSAFRFTKADSRGPFQRERLMLALDYQSTRILIGRPCVCKVESRIAHQTTESIDFDRTMARLCVDAAVAMVDMLPDRPDATYLYRAGPWWNASYHLMQALAVLLLEVSIDREREPQRNVEITENIKKLFNWLGALRGRSPVGKKAYKMACSILRLVVSFVDSDLNDIFSEELARSQSELSTQEDDSTGAATQQDSAFGQFNPQHSYGTGSAVHGYSPVYESTGPYSQDLAQMYPNSGSPFEPQRVPRSTSQSGSTLYGSVLLTTFDDYRPFTAPAGDQYDADVPMPDTPYLPYNPYGS